MSKSLFGKLTELGVLLTSAVAGFLTGMATVWAIDATIGYILVSTGFVPLIGIAGILAVSTLSLIYGFIYMYIGLVVSGKVENYLRTFQSNPELADCKA